MTKERNYIFEYDMGCGWETHSIYGQPISPKSLNQMRYALYKRYGKGNVKTRVVAEDA
jgi:hypothetical protein